ncbi:MAG: heavy-metal-associated domain-containing protein [Chloroflexi bacterium]|nr:heavy-metal-associated domain-containing protein [Chloroflexota bacterium]
MLLASCGGTATSAGIGAGTNPSLSEVALEVPTIWCSDCKLRVEKSIRGVPGVKEVKFDALRIQVVVIAYDTAQTTPQTIVEAIERGGDKVTQTTKP